MTTTQERAPWAPGMKDRRDPPYPDNSDKGDVQVKHVASLIYRGSCDDPGCERKSPLTIANQVCRYLRDQQAAALRQPQAARLTEDAALTIKKWADFISATMRGEAVDDIWFDDFKKERALLVGLLSAAAPVQVTREEIAECIEAEVWFDGPDGTLCGVPNAVKSILSLLAERGLVKESE